MAGHWLQALGKQVLDGSKKALDAGAAALKESIFLKELREMDAATAKERLSHHVKELSPAARSAVALALQAMARNEANLVRRQVYESLAAAVGPASATVATQPGPAAADGLGYEAALQRVQAWQALPAPQQRAALDAFLAGEDERGRAQWLVHVERMRAAVAGNIEGHHALESRAWGGSVEDQLAYGMASLRSGERDPAWRAELARLQGLAAYFDALRADTQAWRAAAPPAPPVPAPEVPVPTTRSLQSAPAEGLPVGDPESAIASLRIMLVQQLADGTVRPERRVVLERLLDKIEALVQAKASGRLQGEALIDGMRRLFQELMPMLADPGSAGRRGTGRQAELDRYVGEMKSGLVRELAESPPEATAHAMALIMGDLMAFQRAAAAGMDADALRAQEALHLRPAAFTSHQLRMARHLMLARPQWACSDWVVSANALFYSGANDLLTLLQSVAAAQGLTLNETRRLQNLGQSRWDALNTTHVAIFDLRGAARHAALPPEHARTLYGTAYELGLALALGKPVVVLAGSEDTLPFDVDVSPIEMSGEPQADAATLAQALDEAFYLPQRTVSRPSMQATLALLDRSTQAHPRRAGFEAMHWLAPELAQDPAGLAAVAEQLRRELPEQGWQLLRPAWPAAYPADRQAGEPRRCFHVMPFGCDWSDGVRDLALSLCVQHGWAYDRGDLSREDRIVTAIWEDLCRADRVLVDLTGYNLNVLIELGMAHAIGRPVLAVQRSDAGAARPKLPRNLEKLRVLDYTDAMGLEKVLNERMFTG